MVNNKPSEILAVVPFAVVLFFTVMRHKRVKACKAELAKLESDLLNLQNDSVLSWLPMDYRTSSCFAGISSYVSNGRADTLKEALNILENEMHQERMVDAAFLGAYYGNN